VLKKKVTKESITPLPLVSLGLSATLVRLRNSPSKNNQAQNVLAV
jgi:hypothetical protein